MAMPRSLLIKLSKGRGRPRIGTSLVRTYETPVAQISVTPSLPRLIMQLQGGGRFRRLGMSKQAIWYGRPLVKSAGGLHAIWCGIGDLGNGRVAQTLHTLEEGIAA